MSDMLKQRQESQARENFRVVWVYFARFDGLIKIGATCDPVRRFNQLRRPEFLFGFYAPGPDCGYDLEAAFHRHFKAKLKRGRDYFELTEQELESAKTLPMVCGIGEPPIVRYPSCECHSKLGESFNWINLPKRPAVMGRINPKLVKSEPKMEEVRA